MTHFGFVNQEATKQHTVQARSCGHDAAVHSYTERDDEYLTLSNTACLWTTTLRLLYRQRDSSIVIKSAPVPRRRVDSANMPSLDYNSSTLEDVEAQFSNHTVVSKEVVVVSWPHGQPCRTCRTGTTVSRQQARRWQLLV